MPLSNIDIPLPLEFVYQHLLDSRLIALVPSNIMQPTFSRWYNLDERCEYQGRVLSHLVDEQILEVVKRMSILTKYFDQTSICEIKVNQSWKIKGVLITEMT
jgi:hypothetical protein